MKIFGQWTLKRSCAAASVYAASITAGCAILLPSAPPALYDLQPQPVISSIEGSTRSQILITEPKVITSLDNDRLVIRPSPAEISFFQGARWSDRLPRLVQLYFSRAFSSTNRAGAIGLPGDGLIIDHQLLFDLRAFQIEAIDTGFQAHIEIDVRILNDKNGRVLASRSFVTTKTSSDDPATAVNTLNDALDEITQNLINWVYQTL